MNTVYKIFQLSKKAEKHFIERFNNGLTLTSFIKERIHLNEGKIITYASSALNKNQLLNFDGSNILDKNLTTNITNYWLMNQIKIFLSQSKNNYCILERADDYPQKGVITRFPFWNVLYKDGEPYYILNNKDSEETILEAIMQNSSYWPLGMGIFTTIENILSYFSDKDHIKHEEFFEVAAKNTQKISVQAYDNIGYVLWEKTK